MGTRYTFLVASLLCCLNTAFSQREPLRKATPVNDSTGTGYYAIDSDDPAPNHPRYNFVDTAYQPGTWHRIYPGPNSIPASLPSAISWRKQINDSTNNTFAGPIPIGFHFNFYGVNYDSVYLSSNGYIGFGNIDRASGNDGPAYSTYHCATLPDTLAPKAIAAFLMTDGEMVQTNADSSRAFYRTSSINDSFFITFYNYYHISKPGNFSYVHNFRADIQIVIAAADSSITFHYRRFTGSVTVGLQPYTSAQVFQNGCFPQPCSDHAAVIGVQNETQSLGTNYLCNGKLSGTENAGGLHDALAVKFRRFRNIFQASSIDFPPRNFEMMIGDSLIPVASFKNVSQTAQSFYCMLRIRYASTGRVAYQSLDSAMYLASGGVRKITFPKWKTHLTDSITADGLIAEAIALPKGSADSWPFDDTLRQSMFLLKYLDNFSDFVNSFSVPAISPITIPDVNKFVSIGATVVDGDINTFSPPPPRWNITGADGKTLHSPVIMLDRNDVTGTEYNRCAFGGGDSVLGNSIGDGGVGDTIISLPIDIHNVRHAVLGFSYERSGKHDYPRWYDLATAVGPERTVTDPTGNVYRAGDSLEVAFADTSQRTNISKWHERWSLDGGKDRNFSRIFLSIDSNFISNHFRFRVRLKAKNDFEPGNPSDDNDAWYLDNFVVVSPLKPEIEVSWARIGPNWPYVRVPASQAVKVPIQIGLANNGGIAGAAFGLCVLIDNVKNPPPTIPSGVYVRLITVPALGSGKSVIITAPTWNARNAGPGDYTLSAFLLPKGYDAESQNDSTYFTFSMQFDSTIVYDGGVNDVANFFQTPGLGLKLQESASYGNPVGGNGIDLNSGTIATRFHIYQRDTLIGATVWFGSFNTQSDAIRICLYQNQITVPGDTLLIPHSTFIATRQPPFDAFHSYVFAYGPLILDPGDYWLGVSQLYNEGYELGASASRSSVDWVVYDPSPNLNHQFVLNDSSMLNLFAFENTALSSSWYPFYFPAGIGKPGYSYYESQTAYTKTSIACGKTDVYFYGQGSWIPMIRPYFGNRSWKQPTYDTLRHTMYPPAFSPDSFAFGEHYSCADTTPVFFDTLHLANPSINTTELDVTFEFSGPDSGDFAILTLAGDVIAAARMFEDQPIDVVLRCRPRHFGQTLATLTLLSNANSGDDPPQIPLSISWDTTGITTPSDTVSFGLVKTGQLYCLTIPLQTAGAIDDTIENISFPPGDTLFTLMLPVQYIVDAKSGGFLTFCYTPTDTGVVEQTLTITTQPCDRQHQIKIVAGRVPTSVAATATQPASPALAQNRPNPFGTNTTIDFDLVDPGIARLIITDILGRVTNILCNQFLSPGHYSRNLSAINLVAGTYCCSLATNGAVVRRMIVVAK